jgi:hypothetical protein
MPGREQSEWVVAIHRSGWSRSSVCPHVIDLLARQRPADLQDNAQRDDDVTIRLQQIVSHMVGKADELRSSLRRATHQGRILALSGVQDSQRTKDGWATAAAVVVFWPAAFFVCGDKQNAAELAQMKGQMVAVEQASIARSATFSFRASWRARNESVGCSRSG